jgi:hypothetical protein
MAVVDGTLVQLVEVAAAPEIALELVGLAARVAYREGLAEDPVPGSQRHQRQQQHHQLDHQAGVDDEFDDGQVLGDVHVGHFGVLLQFIGFATSLPPGGATSWGNRFGRPVETPFAFR